VNNGELVPKASVDDVEKKAGPSRPTNGERSSQVRRPKGKSSSSDPNDESSSEYLWGLEHSISLLRPSDEDTELLS